MVQPPLLWVGARDQGTRLCSRVSPDGLLGRMRAFLVVSLLCSAHALVRVGRCGVVARSRSRCHALRVHAAPIQDERLPRAVLPISLTVFAQLIGEGIAISTLPLHMRSLGATAPQIGLATSAFSLTQLIFCPQVVKLSNKLGRTTMLRGCLLGASFAQLIIALSSNAYGIIFGRFLAGMFSASVPVAQAGVTDLVRGSQAALALSRVSAASQMGIVVGPAVSAAGAVALAFLGVPAHLQVRGIFAISAGFALVVLALTSVAGGSTTDAGVPEASLPTAAPEAAGGSTTPAQWKVDSRQWKRPISATGRRLSDTLPFSSKATKASEMLPLAQAVKSGQLAQVALRLLAGTVGWSLTLCVSTYCLFGSAFLGYGQPQLSATFSSAAALTVLTQIAVFPRLVKRLGEHLTCAFGLSCLAVGMSGFALLKANPYHSILYLLTRFGTAIADTSTATLVVRSSPTSEARAANLALIQSTRAAARIVTPVLSGWLFERSRRGFTAAGALPYLLVASIIVSLIPVPLVLRSFEKRD